MAHQNDEFILRWYNEVWNKGNENLIDEMYHPDGKAFGIGPEPLGRDEFKSFYKTFNDTFSDIDITVDKNLVDGNYVVSLCTVKAVHRATNQPVNFTGTSISELKDGKLINGWNHFDFLTMNIQIGKIKPEQLADAVN